MPCLKSTFFKFLGGKILGAGLFELNNFFSQNCLLEGLKILVSAIFDIYSVARDKNSGGVI